MPAEQNSMLQHILAKLLVLETMQMGIVTFLAGQAPQPLEFLNKLISDAESELRLRAISEMDEPASSQSTADLALKYLAENAASLKSITAEE